MTITIDTIREAARAIQGAVVRTPTVHSRTLSQLTGAEVFLKLENLQYTASFKDRGALVKLLSLPRERRAAGVVAASAGNHAQGVAYHAQRLGIPATIVMPVHTPFIKVVRTRDFGATVVLHGEGVSEAAAHATELAAAHGYTFVHPYDDARIIAGQGTVGLELLEDQPALDALVVPIGGGGLIAGCAIAARALNPKIRIFGVEAALYPSMRRAIYGEKAGDGGPTIAEGIAVKDPGALTRPVVEELIEDILIVDESALERGVQLLLEIEKTVAEGAGAAPLAAVLANPALFAGRKVGLVVSGGNIDSRLLASVLMRGMARDGRIARLRVEITDAPGTLAKVADCIAKAGGNIVEVYHQRLFADVPVKRADLDAVIETRDVEHLKEIIASLESRGFAVRQLGNTAGDGP
ncbi:MAG: threonine ammonia-lyase [Alphaproteobacteria bacterium]|nr:threonine ammonia-lyase [Alphaproteobacteria bacterium]